MMGRLFKLLYNLITEPLGLPIEWYWEWLILIILDQAAYLFAFEKVGQLYALHWISGRTSGSVSHWLIRLLFYLVLRAIICIVLLVDNFVKENPIFAISIVGSIILIIVGARIIAWLHRRET